jgi:ribonuclease BN (tRNA processing enzyme)
MMGVRMTVLASGSSGNATLLAFGSRALLIDIGLGPLRLARDLRAAGCDWSQIAAVVLTHTHTDHWHPRTVSLLAERKIPLLCHADHVRALQLQCPHFEQVLRAGLVRNFQAGRGFEPLPGISCRAVELNHDGGPTFGFRIAAATPAGGAGWAVGYAADLGSWDETVPLALAGANVLAIEFNHDVDLQRQSGRPGWLVERVLGDHGHLSNVQGARLLAECLARSCDALPRHVVQLHLSRDCNHPHLASAAARSVLDAAGATIDLHTAQHDQMGPTIEIP